MELDTDAIHSDDEQCGEVVMLKGEHVSCDWEMSNTLTLSLSVTNTLVESTE